MKREGFKFVDRHRTLSSITPTSQQSELLPSNRKGSMRGPSQSQSQISLHHHREKSLSDSESSDASCLEKKFYKCGCQGLGCGHKYQNYLAELRQERIRKKQKMTEFFGKEQEHNDDLVLSDDQKLFGEDILETPVRASKLQKIAQQSQSAERTNNKYSSSIIVNFAGQKYFKQLSDKEQTVQCILLLERVVNLMI